MPHISVLLQETLASFKDKQLHTFVDMTLGAGGHSKAILEHHPEIKCLIGIDQDPQAREIAAKVLSPWKSLVHIVAGNFSDLDLHLKKLAITGIDGIICDLGVSSMQLDMAEKGFSFMRDGPLDMRMDPGHPLSAADIVNTWAERELGIIFRDYGEEKHWRRAVHAIVSARGNHPITTTLELAELLKKALPFNKKGMHPATLIFQALRIAVNDELTAIRRALPLAIEALSPGGILAVISFHSLEDGIVKNVIRQAADDKVNTTGLSGLFIDKKPQLEIITKKPIGPSDEETLKNPRSRSAKLRVAMKL